MLSPQHQAKYRAPVCGESLARGRQCLYTVNQVCFSEVFNIKLIYLYVRKLNLKGMIFIWHQKMPLNCPYIGLCLDFFFYRVCMICDIVNLIKTFIVFHHVTDSKVQLYINIVRHSQVLLEERQRGGVVQADRLWQTGKF